MRRRDALIFALATGLIGATPVPVGAQAYPTKPVKMIVGFAAGGTADVVARIIGEQLTQRLGKPFIVDNKTGANGMLAAEAAARSDPDGHTIFVSNSSTVTLNPTLFKNLRYNPTTDFAPVTTIVSVPMIVVINAEAPLTVNVRTIADLVALAKKRGTEVSYGSAGVGNVTHLGFEWFSDLAGIKMTHVPYRGVAGTQAALLGKEVTVVLDSPAGIGHIKAGKFRALAVTSLHRLPGLPDVPTMDEMGYKDFEIGYWIGLFVRAGTPDAIIARLNSEIAEIVKKPDVQARLTPHGTINVAGAKEFGNAVKKETERLASIVQKAQITVE